MEIQEIHRGRQPILERKHGLVASADLMCAERHAVVSARSVDAPEAAA